MSAARTLSVTLALLVAAHAPAVRAQVSAADRFDRGVRLSAQGDHRGALVEFQAAFEATRSPEVLFNIAAAHEHLNEYVEAEEVLTRYERLCPPAVFARHRAEVVAAQQRLRERIGVLRVQSAVPSLRCSVDGVSRPTEALRAGLRVSMGRRVLRCDAEGYERFERAVDLRGEESLGVEVSPERRRASLTVVCALPGAQVLVDGAPVGQTPLPAPVPVSEGRHTVTVSHPGYDPVQGEVEARGAGARFEATMRWREPLPPNERAWLTVRASEPSAVVTLDGRRIREGEAVPPGFHRVRVEREDFLPAEREVVLRPGERATEDLRLSPTPAFRASWERDLRARRTRWIALVAGGAAVTAGGALWLALSLPPFLDANRRIDEGGAALAACRIGTCPLGSTAYDLQVQTATREAESLQPQVWISGALLVAGAAALVTGLVLSADAPPRDRFERSPTWHISASPGGLRLSF